MTRMRLLLLAVFVVALAVAPSAQTQKPITNADVIGMVKSELAESTIIAAIQASPINFDISPSGLIALKDAGVSAKVMDAMLAESKKRTASTGRGSSRTGAGSRTGTGSRFGGVAPTGGLTATAIVKGERQPIDGARARIAHTRTKPTSMGALSKDKVLGGVLQAGVRTGVSAGRQAAGGGLAGTAVSQAGGILGQIVGGGSKNTNETVTYVWALEGETATITLPTEPTVIEVSMDRVLNVTADDYAPIIVQLAITEQKKRLIGATEGKTASATAMKPDWELYQNFVEEVVARDSRKTGAGKWEITASLPPGSYAVVLRPVSKSKKYSGREIVNNLRDGLVFNSTWAFDVQ